MPLSTEDEINADGKARQARRVPLDAGKVAVYQSPGDVFYSEKQNTYHSYSAQVPNVVSAARKATMIKLAEGIRNGTEHLRTTLVLNNLPEEGHSQPVNIYLVERLLRRVVKHMNSRAQNQKGHPNTKRFESHALRTISQLYTQAALDPERRSGASTFIMKRWRSHKNGFFDREQKHGHGRLDPEFGWQSTPGMPKLSVLFFLFDPADNMDEFEIELLGQTWAYVTIVLLGTEDCPNYHAHAARLERMAQFNPHVGFYGMNGRVCERMVVEDWLSSAYPVDPPQRSEILKPEFDLPREELTVAKGPVCEWMAVEDSSSSVPPIDPPPYSEIWKPEFDLPGEDLPTYSASQERTCAEK